MNPAIEQLRRLHRFGFHGERVFNQDGQLDLVHYARMFLDVREVVLVHNEHHALAYRTRDLLDPDSPWQPAENAVEWHRHGDVVTVIHALLSLPAPGSPNIPTTQLDPQRAPLNHRAHVIGTELYDWIALRRVNNGGVARMGHHWFDTGFRVPGYVAEALTTLVAAGLVSLQAMDGSGMIRASLTPAGATRYHELCSC